MNHNDFVFSIEIIYEKNCIITEVSLVGWSSEDKFGWRMISNNAREKSQRGRNEGDFGEIHCYIKRIYC